MLVMLVAWLITLGLACPPYAYAAWSQCWLACLSACNGAQDNGNHCIDVSCDLCDHPAPRAVVHD